MVVFLQKKVWEGGLEYKNRHNCTKIIVYYFERLISCFGETVRSICFKCAESSVKSGIFLAQLAWEGKDEAGDV